MKRIALVVVALVSLGVVVAGQTGTRNGEWRDLRRRSRPHAVRAARSDQRGEFNSSKWRGGSRPTTSARGRSSSSSPRR